MIEAFKHTSLIVDTHGENKVKLPLHIKSKPPLIQRRKNSFAKHQIEIN